MGSYLNPGSSAFKIALNSEIFVDKSGLIEITNRYLNTMQRYICVSRPRRFGKSMAADMLAAYYARGIDSDMLFNNLKISQTGGYRAHLNQYDVIKINMQEFLSASRTMEDMLAVLKRYLLMELTESFCEVRYWDKENLVQVMKDIFAQTQRPFVILIDEWDCFFREYKQDKEAQKQYLDFLRSWLKDKDYVGLAYITGILPIKKYGSHSALNMFSEYSMTDPGAMAEYFGFTEEEVQALSRSYDMNFEELKAWYDGYGLWEHSIREDRFYAMYNPKSVVEAMLRHKFGTYWNQTETYEALKIYIQMNMDGLKDGIIHMLSGESVSINTGTFNNDMTTFASRDDVMTLLTHLGYLTYNSQTGTVSIPNKEVSMEYVNAISTMDWQEVTRAIRESQRLLEALWNLDEAAVAEGVERTHEEMSILQYNNENALSCTIQLAFYFAREYYTIIRELPSGKGFADICFLPRKMHLDKPAVLIELKWDQSAQGAIRQIKEKEYWKALKDYKGNLLLVGINYDKDSKEHTCKIEKVVI